MKRQYRLPVAPEKIKVSQRRPVIQVVANLKQTGGGPAASANAAIKTIVDWLKIKQRLKLPAAADRGEPFEIDAAEGQPIAVVRFDSFWSLQFEPPRLWWRPFGLSAVH